MKSIKVKKKYRKLESIENIIKPENMKDIENLKIYKDIGKKPRMKKKNNFIKQKKIKP